MKSQEVAKTSSNTHLRASKLWNACLKRYKNQVTTDANQTVNQTLVNLAISIIMLPGSTSHVFTHICVSKDKWLLFIHLFYKITFSGDISKIISLFNDCTERLKK